VRNHPLVRWLLNQPAVRWLLKPVLAYREYKRLKMEYPQVVSALAQTRQTLSDTTAQLSDTRSHLATTLQERDKARGTLAEWGRFAPPGHFYSPVPSKEDVAKHVAARERRAFLAPLPAINSNDEFQLQVLDCLKPYYAAVPFQAEPVAGLLYHYNNPHYSYTDAIILFCMLNHFRPRRLIEIGSGFSTCAILDVNRRCFDSRIQITSIEPYPELLHSLVEKSNDLLTIVTGKLQDTDTGIFDQLESGDILFIDSTHISKLASDVNHIIFEILPRLKAGVIVQVHDIYLGFEYPDCWLEEGRAWNEAYLLRAFLEYNEHFRTLLFISYLQNKYEAWFAQNMPDTLLNKGGCFWMEKLRDGR